MANAKHARIIASLTAMLAATPEDADFKTVTDEQLNEVRDLFASILNARFPSPSRDSNPVEMHLINRSKYNVHVIFMPTNSLSDIHDPALQMQFVADLARSAEHASSIVADAQRMLGFYTSQLAQQMKKDAEERIDLKAFDELINAEEIEKAEAERDRLLDKYAPTQEYAGDPESSRRVSEDLQGLIDRLGQQLPKERIEAALVEINAAIDEIEPLVGTMIPNAKRMGGHEAPFADRSGDIYRLLRRHQNRIGSIVLRPVIVRWNRLKDEDRGVRLRAAREAAQ